MAPRASWKGYLKLCLVSCPIALYPAASSSERVSFNQINKKTGNRLKQQLVDAETGEAVEKEDIGRGYEFGKGFPALARDCSRLSSSRAWRLCAKSSRAARNGSMRSNTTATACRRGSTGAKFASWRKKLDWTERFLSIADALKALGLGSALIDGEIVVEDASEGRPRRLPEFQLP
jgi:Ku70/Ku80 beta-barrel domain